MLCLSPFLTAYLVTLAGVLGAVMGSFLNCAAWRLARGESVLRGRSRCARCGHTLAARDLVPIFSWLLLRGRCRYCGGAVSKRYIAVECLSALVYITLLLRFDVTWTCLLYGYLLSWLLLGALVDLEEGWIPDRVSVCAAVGYFPLAALAGGGALVLRGVVGALAVFLPLLAAVLVMERILKTEAMGGGDLKLFAVLGLYFGWQQGIFLVLVSCILGLAAMAISGRLKRQTPTPFAPTLYAAAWLTALAGEPFVTWYLGLF